MKLDLNESTNNNLKKTREKRKSTFFLFKPFLKKDDGLSEGERRELFMNGGLLADYSILGELIEILEKKLENQTDISILENTEKKIEIMRKKHALELLYNLLEEIIEISNYLRENTLTKEERKYLNQRRENLRLSLKEDALYLYLQKLQEKLRKIK